MRTIIDTHTHLYDIPDVLKALSDSAAAGVSDIVVLGIDLASNKKHIEIASVPQPLRIHLALGLHPANVTLDEIARFAELREWYSRSSPRGLDNKSNSSIVAIGETGLDFWYKWVRNDDAKKSEQRQAFQMQLDVAREFNLPVVIHSRGTWRECLNMTVAAGVKKAVFHWYSGPMDVLKDILDAGFLISVSPALEYSEASRETAKYAPLDRILVETDTPVMVSMPGGERVPSIPKDVWRTFKALCVLKGLDEITALDSVNANARAFFDLSGPLRGTP